MQEDPELEEPKAISPTPLTEQEGDGHRTAVRDVEEPTSSEDDAEGPLEEGGDDPEETPPGGVRLAKALRDPLGLTATATTGLLILALFYTLYAAASFFMPVVLALLLNFLLSPAVRFLERLRIPTPLGAGIVLVGLLAVVGVGGYYLATPATEWVQRAPQSLREAERKFRGIKESVEKVQEATKEVQNITNGGDGEEREEPVEVKQATVVDTLLSQTQAALAGMAVMAFLLYFLLASGDLFLRKLVHVLPMMRRKRTAVTIAHRIERDLSTFLFTVAIINTVLGSVVAFGLYLIGMPNPILWGIMVGLLNFIPYLGALVGVAIVGLVAFISFDSTLHALAAPALYFTINAIEGNLVTPMIMGRRLTLNPVAIFISLTFWGWMWGVMGALLAVPLLVAFKIVCDNITTLSPVGEFLGR